MGQKSTLIFFGCASRWAPPWACDPMASYGPELFVLYCFVTPANLFRAKEQIVRICSLFKLCRVAFADKLYQSVCVTPNCRRCASLRCMFGFKAIFDQRVQRHPEAKASQILALEFWMYWLYWWAVRVFPTALFACTSGVAGFWCQRSKLLRLNLTDSVPDRFWSM